MTKQRIKQIRVRLSPSVDNQACQVAFSEEEYTALRNVATTLGYGDRGFSTYLRTIAERGAMRGRTSTEHTTVLALLQAAADEARLPLSAWMRLMVLESAGLSLLGAQLKAVG